VSNIATLESTIKDIADVLTDVEKRDKLFYKLAKVERNLQKKFKKVSFLYGKAIKIRDKKIAIVNELMAMNEKIHKKGGQNG